MYNEDVNVFLLDKNLDSTCFHLGDWPLSRVLLKNTRHYPWFILVPRRINVTEINQLAREDRHLLMDEISQLSSIVEEFFTPNKLNVGALGNIVSQLHIHVVARFTADPLWPYAIWQQHTQSEEPYTAHDNLLDSLRKIIKQSAVRGMVQ